MRRTPVIAVLAAVVLLMTGCSAGPTVAANVALQFPDPMGFLIAQIYGLPLLALLSIVVGVIVIITLVTTFRAARAGRTARRWPVVVSVVLTAVLIVVAVLLLVGLTYFRAFQ